VEINANYMQQMFSLQILLLAQHVSGTIMPIIRSSRVLYSWLLPVVFGALVCKLSLWCGAEGCVFGLRSASSWHFISTQNTHCMSNSLFFPPENCAIHEIRRKSTVGSTRPHMT
jgi:hypothetical protein